MTFSVHDVNEVIALILCNQQSKLQLVLRGYKTKRHNAYDHLTDLFSQKKDRNVAEKNYVCTISKQFDIDFRFFSKRKEGEKGLL